jgi:Rieske Fe-S protein
MFSADTLGRVARTDAGAALPLGEEGMELNRRRFLNWFLGTAFGALCASVLYPITRYISPPEVPEATTNQVDAGPINDPELIEKGFKILRFGTEPVILIKVGDGDYRAFSAHVIWCNCHNGEYDLNGRNIAGPPPRPLTPFKVHLVEREGQAASLIVERS